MTKKIGIYGGTFDPIHHAHLILARETLETLPLDEIVFVPAAISPHKLEQAPSPAEIRVEMLRAAIANEPRFSVDELELRRAGPSFTIDTVLQFRGRDPQAQLFYLIGSDNLPRLATWSRFAELSALVDFVILDRGAIPPETNHRVIRRSIDISATEIRNRVAAGRSIRYFVPSAVEEIIQRRQLYQEPSR